MTTEQIRVNIKFINANCNDFGFDFDNYENEFRNANVIDVVYKLIEKFCTKNIHYSSSIKKSKEADELIFLDANRKEEDDKINKKDTFNGLSPISTNYTIYVVFRLLDKPLHQPSKSSNYLPNTEKMTMAEFGGGKKQTRNKNKKRGTKRTNKKYCNKCKTKKTLHHKHKYTNKNKNKK